MTDNRFLHRAIAVLFIDQLGMRQSSLSFPKNHRLLQDGPILIFDVAEAVIEPEGTPSR